MRCAIAVTAPTVATVKMATEASDLEKENEELQQRLKVLQNQLKEEEQFSYIVTRGFISGAENVFSETMEAAEAKQWCNSHDECALIF